MQLNLNQPNIRNPALYKPKLSQRNPALYKPKLSQHTRANTHHPNQIKPNLT